jgi:hypothetical protein
MPDWKVTFENEQGSRKSYKVEAASAEDAVKQAEEQLRLVQKYARARGSYSLALVEQT